MEKSDSRIEAERWVDVAGKLLEARDLHGSKRFARRAQETDSQVEGADQIIAVIDVLLASEKRINNHLDWYAILQIDRRSNDLELIKRQYKKFLLLLHPDKNKSAFADNAFKLICDAWTFLSDPSKKALYDNEVNLFMKFDPIVLSNQRQEPARRSVREKKQTAKAAAAKAAAAAEEEEEMETARVAPPPQQKEFSSRKESRSAQGSSRLLRFWTLCPYCYHLYEYPRVYEDCCLRCQNCRRGFHGVEVLAPPPPVGPGKDSYYCSWAYFPVGYTTPDNLGTNLNWSPFASMFSAPSEDANTEKRTPPRNDSDVGNDSADTQVGKKGRTESANISEGINMVNMSVQDMSGANNVEPQKTARMKSTARKSVLPKHNNQTVKEPHNMSFEGNVSNNTVQDGAGANNGGPRKTLIKTTARKSTLPLPQSRTNIEPQNKISGEKSVPEWIGMDLNLEVQAEAEEPRKVSVVDGVEVGSIDKEATEGIGFFEGLDDILGNLPLLNVPGAQKAEMLVEK